MRFNQYRGLNEWARKNVLKREKVRQHGVNVYADGRRKSFNRWAMVPVARVRVIGTIQNSYNPQLTVAPLREFTMPDGRVLREYVQATIHCGGPVYHTALRDVRTGKPVKASLWTDKELDQA